MQKIILRNNSTINPFKLIKTYLKTRTVFNKLKDLIVNRSRFEEESMLYTYEGEDKNAIWEVMEFFYVSLWTKEFDPFVYTDPADDWENYNFYIHYKNHLYELYFSKNYQDLTKSCIENIFLI